MFRSAANQSEFGSFRNIAAAIFQVPRHVIGIFTKFPDADRNFEHQPEGRALTEQKHPHDETCLFCRIAGGDVPAFIVHEDEEIMAFLDIGPIRPGHVDIIPKAHYSYFDDLPEELAGRIMALGQRIARAQKRIFGVGRVGFMFTGGDVAHAHAHLVPMITSDDITSRRYIVEETVTYRTVPMPPREELAKVAADLAGLI